MPTKSQRLELTWIGKDEQPKLEPRILIEDPSKSFGDPKSQNMLIHGDNLLALKALEQDFAGKIKCIYIDPPYNTGSAFEHYDDGLEHSLWLSLIKPRLDILKHLLSTNGTIWVSIDDNEYAYLRIVMDDVFGRNNFIATVVWQKRTSPEARYRLGAAHDYILVYGKDAFEAKNELNQLPASESRKKDFKNPDKDPRGVWASVDITGMAGHATPSQFYTITAPNGKKYKPPPGRCWVFNEENFKGLIRDKRIWFGKDGNAKPRLKRFIFELEGQNSWTWWTNTEVGHNQEAKKEVLEICGNDNVFDTPKPERLLHRIITLATKENEWVLDSFFGSGTTAAVAHKMGRRWIGIELGDHAVTHCLPRLKKVVKGEDQGGISESVDWKSGGGFKFYSLAPSLLKKDSFGNWVIDESYNPDMLAATMAKHENYRYHPSDMIFWKQGQSTEKDFIYTTTQFVTKELIDKIHEQMQAEESLLICCKSFQGGCTDGFPNINVKKIPNMLLGRCEFGREDYSLNIINLPHDEDTDKSAELEDKATPDKKLIKRKKPKDQSTLFDEDE